MDIVTCCQSILTSVRVKSVLDWLLVRVFLDRHCVLLCECVMSDVNHVGDMYEFIATEGGGRGDLKRHNSG